MLDKLMEINLKGKTVKTDKLHLGEGVLLGEDFPKIKNLYIPYKKRSTHFGCVGTTRIGKTKFISYLASQDILAGNSVVVVDPKADNELLSSVISATIQAGRLNDLMFISPVYSDYSLRIDPLAYYYVMDEIIDHVTSGIQSNEEFFITIAEEITTAIVSSLVAQAYAKGETPLINFFDIKQRITYESLRQILENMNFFSNHPDERVRQLAEETIMNVEHVLSSPQEYFGKVSSTLRTMLTAMTSSTTGKIIGRARTNEFIRRFEEGEPVILYCNTGSLLLRRKAYTIGRILLSMIQASVGRAIVSGKKINPPLCLYLDEGDTILYNGVENMFNKAGGANVWLHFFTQSFSQIKKAVGQNITESIIDNISTWIYMKVNCNETASYIEEASPKKTIWKIIPSVADAKASFSMREEEERLILGERVIKLKPRYFYMRHEGEFYKGRVPFIKPTKIKILFPDLRVKHAFVKS